MNVDELIEKVRTVMLPINRIHIVCPKMWAALDLVQVYTKPRRQPPDYTSPVVLKREKSSIEDLSNVCRRPLSG